MVCVHAPRGAYVAPRGPLCWLAASMEARSFWLALQRSSGCVQVGREGVHAGLQTEHAPPLPSALGHATGVFAEVDPACLASTHTCGTSPFHYQVEVRQSWLCWLFSTADRLICCFARCFCFLPRLLTFAAPRSLPRTFLLFSSLWSWPSYCFTALGLCHLHTRAVLLFFCLRRVLAAQ